MGWVADLVDQAMRGAMDAMFDADAGAATARILLAALLGSVIGWERERHGRAAGLRTHLLLCTGCALVMLVSLHLPTLFVQFSGDSVVRSDPGRIAAHVLSGLGFLGAGAIIVLGHRVRGLTTAACVWVTAAVGLAVGCGYHVPALVTVVVAVFALRVMGRWERHMPTKDRYINLRLTFASMDVQADAVADILQAHALKVIHHATDWHAGTAICKLELCHAEAVDFHAVAVALVENLEGAGLTALEWTD